MEKEQGKQSFRQRLMGFRPKNLKDYLLAVAVLFKWLLLAVGIGLIVGSISALFGHTLIFVNNLRAQHPWIIYTLPVGGLLIVLLYRGCRNTSDKGTNTVVASIQESTDIPFKMAPLIFVSTPLLSCVAALPAGRVQALRAARSYHPLPLAQPWAVRLQPLWECRWSRWLPAVW